MILFCALLGVFAIGAPGVPGGTVMASLGNQRSRITLMQVIEQLSQRRLLRIGIGVAGCLAVTGKPSHILHAYGEDILR